MIRAHLHQDHHDYMRRTVRLMVVDDLPDGRQSVWMGGDVWQTGETETVTEDPGVVLPVEAVDALRDALDRYEGRAAHAATEAAVLREALAVERARVDRVLNAQETTMAARVAELREERAARRVTMEDTMREAMRPPSA